MNATNEVGGPGSEHVHKPQLRRLTNQLTILHCETRSHDMVISTSLVEIASGPEFTPQELLHNNSCGS